MRINKSWLVVLAAVAVLASAQTVRAITNGEADNGRHPNVGAVMLFDYQNPVNPEVIMDFSGVLVSPRVFLTAGHCTAFIEWTLDMAYTDLGNWYVTFNDDPYDQTHWLPIADVRTHPGYKSFTGASGNNPGTKMFLDAGGNTEDVGVIILEEATDILPVALPTVGLLDELKKAKRLEPETKILGVGYGAHATFAPPGPVYDPHNRELVFGEYRGLNERWLHLSKNPALGNGGGGYGDSGGPRYWVDPVLGEQFVAIGSWGDPKLVALDVAYRIDTPTALGFIYGVIDDLDDCGALVLGLLGGDAAAGTRRAALWPKGAELTVDLYWSAGASLYRETVSWPIASGAHHYRITQTVIKSTSVGFYFNISPVTYTIGSDGRAYYSRYCGGSILLPSLRVTVTAYDGPDEATAYSESLSYRR
jgi:hypothetical protein